MTDYPPTRTECHRLLDELKQLDASSGHDYNARKYEIIHDLAEAHFYEAKSYLAQGLDSPDPDYRWACISALATHWRLTDPQIASRLLEMADDDPDIQVRMISVDSLGNLEIQEAQPLLQRIAEEQTEDVDLRQLAYQSLYKLQRRAITESSFYDLSAECQQWTDELQRLDRTLGDERNARKYELIHNLARAKCYDAKSYLIAGLQNQYPGYRHACITALVTYWRMADEAIVSKLMNMAETDPDEWIRKTATFALGQLRIRDALTLLKRIIETDSENPALQRVAYSYSLQILDYSENEIRALLEDFVPASLNVDHLREPPPDLNSDGTK